MIDGQRVYTGIQSIGTTCTLGDIEENGDVDDDTETFPMSAVQDPQDPPAWVTPLQARCRGIYIIVILGIVVILPGEIYLNKNGVEQI